MKKRKKAQVMGMPFVLIFSLILIVAFIFVAIKVTKDFIESRDRIEIGLFKQNLQSTINELYQVTEASKSYHFNLPSRVKYVCFSDNLADAKANFTEFPDLIIYKSKKANLFFYPPRAVENLDTAGHYKITCNDNECLNFVDLPNPYCIKNDNGISLTLTKTGTEIKIK